MNVTILLGTRLALHPGRRRHGLSLLELVAVVAILALLAGALVPLLARFGASARDTAAKASLVAIRDAIVGKPDAPGFQSDVGRVPNSTAELLATSPPTGVPSFDRNTALGWRGPYLTANGGRYDATRFGTAFGYNNDPAVLDPWGSPIVVQRLIVSGGVLHFIDHAGVDNASSTGVPDGDYSRIVCAGANRRFDVSTADLLGINRGDDLLIYLNMPDPRP